MRRLASINREMRYKTREEQILTEAAHLMRSRGYHAVSMQEIADRCGLQKGGLYHYFKSKEDILDRIFNGSYSIFLPALEEIALRNLDPEEKLRQAIERHITILCENLDFASVVLQDLRALPEELRAGSRKKGDRYLELLRSFIDQGIAAGKFRPVNVPLISLEIMGMLNWTFQWYSPTGQLQPAQIAEVVWEFVSFGLMPVTKEQQRGS